MFTTLKRNETKRKLRHRIFDKICNVYDKIGDKMESKNPIKSIVATAIYRPYQYTQLGSTLAVLGINHFIQSKRLDDLAHKLYYGTSQWN